VSLSREPLRCSAARGRNSWLESSACFRVLIISQLSFFPTPSLVPSHLIASRLVSQVSSFRHSSLFRPNILSSSHPISSRLVSSSLHLLTLISICWSHDYSSPTLRIFSSIFFYLLHLRLPAPSSSPISASTLRISPTMLSRSAASAASLLAFFRSNCRARNRMGIGLSIVIGNRRKN
jgi:hypothetical protein